MEVDKEQRDLLKEIKDRIGGGAPAVAVVAANR